MKEIIADFRSDTVTLPTKEMIDAIKKSRLGDDVYREDETTNQLENLAAKKMGKEAAPVIEMKDLIANIAKALVDKPEEVITTEIKGQQTSVIELKVAKEDVGKVIGKQGRTAQALRNILMSASIKLKKRCILEILE